MSDESEHEHFFQPCLSKFTTGGKERIGWESRPTPVRRYPWRCPGCGEVREMTHDDAIKQGWAQVWVW